METDHFPNPGNRKLTMEGVLKWGKQTEQTKVEVGSVIDVGWASKQMSSYNRKFSAFERFF